jgi:hypothetical protein
MTGGMNLLLCLGTVLEGISKGHQVAIRYYSRTKWLIVELCLLLILDYGSQATSTVEPGARGLHRKFQWSQLITAFSGGWIGGGGPLVVRAQPAQLVVRWWLQLPLQ